MKTTDLLEPALERQAGAKLGWYIHAFVYVAVNLLLVLLSAVSGKHWAIFPVLVWGLGLAIHGMVVFLVTGGTDLHARLVQREREHLSVAKPD